MSVDYRIQIKRNCDNKLLGEFCANRIKTILDSEYASFIHCAGRCCEDVKFTIDDLRNIQNDAFNKIEINFSTILEKKLMITCANSVDIKNELEADIYSIKNEFNNELRDIIESASFLEGEIACIVENQLDANDNPAYEYNAKDLPEDKYTNNGVKYKSLQMILLDNIYCVIKVDF